MNIFRSALWQMAAATLLALGAALPVWANPAAAVRPKVLEVGAPSPASALFIGNSFFYYNNSLHNHVSHLAAASVPKIPFAAVSVTISGSGANWHDVESYFRPNALASYTFDHNNNIVFNQPGDHLFDLAIMMDCSQCPIHPSAVVSR